jgi:signal peptidase I
MMRLVRRFVVVTAVFVFCLVCLSWTTTYLGQLARVEGSAMAPTLENGELILVNKLAYQIGAPRRDDVVMLRYPVNPRKRFVHRIVGEQGDTVRIAGGRVSVNDVPRADAQVPEAFRSHDEWGPQVVPEGYCFVMGDHRNDSADSRHWGFVPVEYVLGRVAYRLTGSRPFSAVR